jgi:transcriptional regulator with XRE-family HTH domain
MSAIGDAIRQDRDDRRLSQAMLAGILNVSQQVLSRWESGVNFPRGSRVDALVSLFGPESRTATLVKRLRDIEPTTFDSMTTALPMTMDARARRRHEAAMGDFDPATLGALRNFSSYDYESRERAAELSRGRDANLSLQFARASEQVHRATRELARCSEQLTRAVELLRGLEISIGHLNQQHQPVAEPPPKGE